MVFQICQSIFMAVLDYFYNAVKAASKPNFEESVKRYLILLLFPQKLLEDDKIVTVPLSLYEISGVFRKFTVRRG